MKYYCRVPIDFVIEDGPRTCIAKGQYSVEKWDNNTNVPWLRDSTEPKLREIDHVDIRIQVFTPNFRDPLGEYDLETSGPEEKYWMIWINQEIEKEIKSRGDDYNWLEDL